MLFDQITIVGVGLIGGSVGLAAKARRGIAKRIVGVDRNTATLTRAVQRRAIDVFETDLAKGVEGSGLVVVCTPVDLIAETILQAAPHCQPGTIFTDGGSTKQNIIVSLGTKLPQGIDYVPAHPIAGAEKNGIDHARADLFEGKFTILTEPPEGTSNDAYFRVAAFWLALDSFVEPMDPLEHDQALARTSHLPHAVSAALAGVTPVDLLWLSAGGFRDTTRIAAGDPGLWTAIFMANRDAVSTALDEFDARLKIFRQAVADGDSAAIETWLTEAKKVRDALGT